jgi:hypothetical protein
MYRHCLYCSADLGTNDAIERFPVGRTVAVDAAKGRLWAVCPKCARWNLAPIEERWEAVEAAEKLFAGTSLRAQRENVGIARLRDGTRLVRVGAALPGEMAVWRYGAGLVERRRKYLLGTAGLAAVGAAFVVAHLAIATAIPGMMGFPLIWNGLRARGEMKDVVVHRFDEQGLEMGGSVTLRAEHVRYASLLPAANGDGFDLHVPHSHVTVGETPDGVPAWIRYEGFRLVGSDARNGLGRGFTFVNAAGGSRRMVDAAMELLAGAGDADGFLRSAAEARQPVRGGKGRDRRPRALALEMALHAESERRSLDGELALLESAWKQAEELASIADGLAAQLAGVTQKQREAGR